MKYMPDIDKMTKPENRLHELISADLSRSDSLILTMLEERFTSLCASNASEEVAISEILSFMNIRKKEKVNATNVRTRLKKTLRDKLANMRLTYGVDSKKLRSCFKISEVIEYCAMLQISPESLFSDRDASIMLPVEYCSIEQIKEWFLEAKKKEEISEPIRVPFLRAPIVDVSLDVYFSASKNDVLEEMIAACHPVEVGEPSFDKKGQPIENYVQMQALLTARSNRGEFQFKPKVLTMFKAKKIRNDGLEDYLHLAKSWYATICMDRYEAEREHNRYLPSFKDDGMVVRYYSDGFAEELRKNLDYHTRESRNRRRDRGSDSDRFMLDDMIKKASAHIDI